MDEDWKSLYDYLIIEQNHRGKVISFFDIPFIVGNCEAFYEFYIFNSYNFNIIDVQIKLVNFLDRNHNNVSVANFVCKINNFESFKNGMKELNSKIKSDNWVIYNYKLVSSEKYKNKVKFSKLFKSENIDKCWVCLEYCLPNEHLFCQHLIHYKCAETCFRMNNYVFTCGICKGINSRDYIRVS